MNDESGPVSQVLAAVTRSLGPSSRDAGLDGTLRRITSTAVQALPGVDFASISIMYDDGRLETKAPTDDICSRLDTKQYELHEGPCYEVVADEGVVRSQHVATDSRWPAYAPIAADAGIGSQMALEVYRNHASRGGLNLYSLSPGMLGDHDTPAAELFATYAAVAMGYAYEVENLNDALATRKVIGQAIGIVMERYGMSEDRAFAFLVRVSQTGNVKLRLVADEIVGRTPPQRKPTA